MANSSASESSRTLILHAIKQKNPGIQAGQTFDWLIISNKLRHDLTVEEFILAMRQLGSDGLIAADDGRRAFTLTEKGFEALHANEQASGTTAADREGDRAAA